MTDVFTALADPTRRRILELVAVRECTAGELAAEFATSRPAVSRHLRVLRDAGLVTWRGEAQRRLYRLDGDGLDAAGGWIDRTRDDWSGRLDAFERHLDDLYLGGDRPADHEPDFAGLHERYSR